MYADETDQGLTAFAGNHRRGGGARRRGGGDGRRGRPGGDEKKVKKIANKQIDKRASNLSVRHANTAGSANTANTADGLSQTGLASLANSFQSKARWAFVLEDGSIAAQTGGITVEDHTASSDYLNFGSPVNQKPKLVVGYNANAVGFTCGGASSATNPDGSACAAHNDFNHVFVPKAAGINGYLVMVFV